MMKQIKIKRIGAASLAALMLLSLAACSKDDDATTQPAGKKLVMTAYNGENEQSMTRGAHWEDNDTHTGGLSFHWDVAGNNQAGDELYDIYSMVINNDGTIGTWSVVSDKEFNIPFSSLKIELTGQPNKATLTSEYYLDVSKHSAGNAIYCITPFSDPPVPDVPNLQYLLAMPTDNAFTQAASGNAEHLKEYMFMTGTGTLKEATNQQLTSSEIYFKHIPATIRIALTNQRPEAATVTSIVMRETDGNAIFPNEKQWRCLMGTVADESTRISIVEPTVQTGYTSSVTLKLTGANVVAAGDKYYGYMLVFPQDAEHALADKHLTFDLITQDGNTYTSFSMDASDLEKITKKKNFVSGYVYTFNLTLNDNVVLESCTISSWGPGEGGSGSIEI